MFQVTRSRRKYRFLNFNLLNVRLHDTTSSRGKNRSLRETTMRDNVDACDTVLLGIFFGRGGAGGK